MQKKIILGHSFWGRGGAEIAAMWVLEALCGEYQIDIVTRGGWDLDDLNQCAGTNIHHEDIGVILSPPLIPHCNSMGGALWHGLYLRYCRYVAPRYDLCITASRVIDWGRPAIHFLSDVAWNLPLQRRFDCAEALNDSGVLRRLYSKTGEWLAGVSDRDPTKHDVFVANSQWTAQISADYCGMPPVVIYPAVPACKSSIPWEKREDEFLCLGRISPEKKIEQVIAILDQVRAMGHPVHLHLVGNGDDSFYVTQIEKLCHKRSDWVKFHGALFGDEKHELLSRCRYGISACDREAFGIATAEMVKAGVVPFVPAVGAQREIVRDENLIYGGVGDGESKIAKVLKSKDLQLQLHNNMTKNAEDFTFESFSQGVRDVLFRVMHTQLIV